MNQYAIVREGAEPEIVDAVIFCDGRAIPLGQRFHPDVIAQMVPYDASTSKGNAAAPTLAGVKDALREAATAERKRVESGGIAYGAMRIATGRDDQDRITSVIVNAERAGIESVDFKAASGWVTADLAALQEIAKAVALHVQACFSAERTHHDAIDALDNVADAVTYNAYAGWPA